MRLYALGSNGSCQLGLDHDDDVSVPSIVTLPAQIEGIAHIACGGNHTVLLDTKGHVYISGHYSQYGINIFQDIGLQDIKLCAATWEASFFVTREGPVLVCGIGRKGEIGPDGTEAPIPTAVPDFPPHGLQVIGLEACMSHVVAVLSDGSVWGWGAGRQGQLGLPHAHVYKPRRLDIGFAASHAVCGKDFTFVYNLLASGVVEKRRLLGPKRDAHGLAAAVQNFEQNWGDAQASWSGLFLWSLSGLTGILLGLGRNDHGQLPPVDLPAVSSFAVGSEHAVAVTPDEQVVAWGWGEHGNCGLPKILPSGTWNTLTVDGRPVKIFAGCATTWIVTE